MSETYILRLSKYDRTLSNEGFVLWLKDNGHQVWITNSHTNLVNGMPARNYSQSDTRPSWADGALSGLIDAYDEYLQQETAS